MNLSEKLQSDIDALNAKREEDKARYDALETKNAEGAAKIEAVERKIDAVNVLLADAKAREPKDDRRISPSKLMRAIRFDDWTDAGFEKEVCENEAKRAQAAGTDSKGGYIVPLEYMPNEFIPTLENALVIAQAGARIIRGLTGGPVVFPKQSGGATAYWVAENASITESEIALADLRMEPHAVVALVKMSNRVLRMSNPSIDAMVVEDMALRLAEKIDYSALFGIGPNQPEGLIYDGDVSNITAAAKTAAQLHLIKLRVASKNAGFGTLGWIMNETQWDGVTQLTDDNNRPLMTGSLGEGYAKKILGVPAHTTNMITGNHCFYGNWADLLIGYWGGVEFLASEHAGFVADQTWVRAIVDVDVAVRHGESFAYQIWT